MKGTIFLFAFFTFVSTLAMGQAAEEKQVLAALDRWKKALFAKDEGTLKSVLADELTYGHSSGVIESKADFIHSITSGKSAYYELELTNMEVTLVGTTALVRHKMTGDIVDNGNRVKPNLGVLQVWVKRKGNWQMVARQAFKL